MLLFVARRKPCSMVLPFLTAHRGCLPRFFSATQNPNPKRSHFMVDEYLIASCGFSPDKAARISKQLTHLKSPEKPNSVLRFLNHQGFSEAEIHTLIKWCPKLLCSSPENTLEPNLHALQDIGLSRSALTQILLSNPQALQVGSAVPRIKFWCDFFGGNETALVKVFKLNKRIVHLDISKNIEPKISFLHSYGFSALDIERIVLRIPRFIGSSVGSMENMLKRATELGFRIDSGMFLVALNVMSGFSREKLQKKMEMLKRFGWTADQFLSALRSTPTMVRLSEENLRAKMEFFLGEARCDPFAITLHPFLLQLSLEKRLRPRQHVLHLLESKGLSGKGRGFFSVMKMTNNKFVEKCIIPYKNEIPELYEAYLITCPS